MLLIDTSPQPFHGFGSYLANWHDYRVPLAHLFYYSLNYLTGQLVKVIYCWPSDFGVKFTIITILAAEDEVFFRGHLAIISIFWEFLLWSLAWQLICDKKSNFVNLDPWVQESLCRHALSVVLRPASCVLSCVRPASVRLFAFSTSSPEPPVGLSWNLVWGIGATSRP